MAEDKRDDDGGPEGAEWTRNASRGISVRHIFDRQSPCRGRNRSSKSTLR